MKKEIIIIMVISLIVGIIIGNFLFPTVKIKTECNEDYSNSMQICEGICNFKGLLSAGVGENENPSQDTKQQSYDYSCNCLAQPMKICQSDSDCVAGVGYCDITGTRICLPIKN